MPSKGLIIRELKNLKSLLVLKNFVSIEVTSLRKERIHFDCVKVSRAPA